MVVIGGKALLVPTVTHIPMSYSKTVFSNFDDDHHAMIHGGNNGGDDDGKGSLINPSAMDKGGDDGDDEGEGSLVHGGGAMDKGAVLILRSLYSLPIS